MLKDNYYYLRGNELADHKNRFETIVQKLRVKGYKITPQRLAIVKILAKSEGHPSVEDI